MSYMFALATILHLFLAVCAGNDNNYFVAFIFILSSSIWLKMLIEEILEE